MFNGGGGSGKQDMSGGPQRTLGWRSRRFHSARAWVLAQGRGVGMVGDCPTAFFVVFLLVCGSQAVVSRAAPVLLTFLVNFGMPSSASLLCQ